ncbi:hypothetical protein DU40_13585 [Methanosarcina mazei]|uniref:Uncharacterized protein n=1 Tax=Methanosarcina mazei TaxID=2209 RepID=A0A0F8DT76_METMZ|nr:hypothetical protein [Methanosarcina mazei]KKG05873.1 hypothetical protein DU40_13585 [Methanosarcina mazei]
MQKDIELSGKLGKKRGNTKSKDCKTKTLILGCVVEKPATVGEIFKRTGFTGTYKSLAGMIRTYHDYGYLYRSGNKPFTYTISELGLEHLENPRLAREALIERRQANAVAVTRRFLLGMDEESRNNFLTEMGIQPVEQHVTIAKNEPAKPDKVTVKVLPEPVEKAKNEIKTNTRTEYVSRPEDLELIRELEEMLASVKEENENMARELAGRTIAKAENSTKKPPKVRNYDELLIRCKDTVVGSSFFNEVPYNLYVVIAELTKASMKELLKEKLDDVLGKKDFKKGRIVLVSDVQASALLRYKFVRKLKEEEYEKIKPKVEFRSDGVYIVVDRLHFADRMCDLPQIQRKSTPIIHHS